MWREDFQFRCFELSRSARLRWKKYKYDLFKLWLEMGISWELVFVYNSGLGRGKTVENSEGDWFGVGLQA